MMTLYGFPKTRATRATWALEEVGAAYEYIKVDITRGEGRGPPYSRLNPTGAVPTLVDGDFVLTESAAIVNYVGERSPDAALVPASGTRARAIYDRWCYFTISTLEEPLTTVGKHTFVLPEDKRTPAVIPTALWEFARAAAILSDALGDRPFILGEQFSGADILIGHTLAWATAFKVPFEQDNLKAYAGRTLSRPALARASAREAGGATPAS